MTSDDKYTPRGALLEKSQSRRRLLTHNDTPPDESEEKNSEEVDGADDVKWRLSLTSSDCFEKIMGDIEGKMVEKLKQQFELTRKRCQSDGKSHEPIEEPPPVILLELDDEEDEESEQEADKQTNVSPLRVKAKRAWTLIRRYIREQSMNKKQNKSNLQWGMLQQTLKNMKNMDAARGDLYNKYLNPSNPRGWTEGIRSIPQGFFGRHSKELLRKSGSLTTAKPTVSQKTVGRRSYNQ